MAIKTDAVITLQPQHGSNSGEIYGAITLPGHALKVPYRANVRALPANGTSEHNRNILDSFQLGLSSEQFSPQLSATFKTLVQEAANQNGSDLSKTPPLQKRITVPPSLASFIRASRSPLTQSLYSLWHTGENLIRDSLRPKEKVAPALPVRIDEDKIANLGLARCALIKSLDESASITLNEMKDDPLTFEVDKGKECIFHWIIGAKHPTQIPELDKLATQFKFEKSYSDLTPLQDKGLAKGFWDGPLLIALLPRMEIDPENPNKVERHVVELIISEKAVFSVDLSGDHLMLLRFKDEMLQHKVASFNLSSPGALAAYMIEQIMRHNFRILDTLDERIKPLNAAVRKNALPADVISSQIPDLQEALEYMGRKTDEVSDIIEELSRAQKAQKNLFNGEDAVSVLATARQSTRRVLSRIQGLEKATESLFTNHDNRRKESNDIALKLLTIPVAVGVPPIVGEIFCRSLLEHEKFLHPPIMWASFICAGVMAVLPFVTDWNPSSWFGRLFQRRHH